MKPFNGHSKRTMHAFEPSLRAELKLDITLGVTVQCPISKWGMGICAENSQKCRDFWRKIAKMETRGKGDFYT